MRNVHAYLMKLMRRIVYSPPVSPSTTFMSHSKTHKDLETNSMRMTYVKPISWHVPKPQKGNRMGKILKNFATIVICYPLTHRYAITSGKSKVFKFLVLAIQIFFSLVVSIISLDGIINKTFNPSPQTSPLSVEIEILLFYLGSMLPDALVRISSLLLYRDIIELVDRIESVEWKKLFRGVGRGRKLFLLVSNMFLCSAWFIFCLASTVQLELNLVLREDLKLYLLPHDEVVVKSVYIFSDSWAMISALYGWIFYIYVGICLVTQLENFTVDCESLLVSERVSHIDDPCGSLPSPSCDTRRIFQLMDEFEGIKSSYECFGRVGGTYALSLLVLFVLNTVGVLSYAMNGLSGEGGDYDYSVGNYIYVCFPSIVSIIYFGDYVTNSVSFFTDFQSSSTGL